jgi:hypothetical protein
MERVGEHDLSEPGTRDADFTESGKEVPLEREKWYVLADLTTRYRNAENIPPHVLAVNNITRAEFDVYLMDLADEARKERELRDALAGGPPPTAPRPNR